MRAPVCVAAIALCACAVFRPLSAAQVEVRVRQTPGGPQLFVDGEMRVPRWVYPAGAAFLQMAYEPWGTNSLEFAVTGSNVPVQVQLRFNPYLRGKERATVWVRNLELVELATGREIGLSGSLASAEAFDRLWKRMAEKSTGEVGFGDGGLAVSLYQAPDPHNRGDFHLRANLAAPRPGRYRLSYESRSTGRQPVYPRVLAKIGAGFVQVSPGDGGVYDRTVKLAADAGVDFITPQAPSAWLPPDRPQNWKQVDAFMRRLIDLNPKALIVPRIGVDAPGWMLAAHPEMRLRRASGELLAKSSPSCRFYRKAACEYVEKLARHLATTFPRNFAGLHVCGQNTGEWFYYHGYGMDLLGYDPYTRDAFREWLAAHGDKDAATAEVPPVEDRRKGTAGVFHDPVREARVVAFNRFYQEEIASFLSELGAAIRRGTDGKSLAVFFYGYHWELAGNGAESGHLALDWLLKNGRENVDILSGPISYPGRQKWPGTADAMGPAETLARAGVMWFNEDDTRTCKEPIWDFITCCGGPPIDKPQTIRTLKRNLAQDIMRGFGCWWMDLFGRGWFDDEDLWKVMKALRPIDEAMLFRRAPFSPDIAVIVDEKSLASLAAGSRHLALPPTMRPPFSGCGAPYGQYLLQDALERPLSAKMRVYAMEMSLTAAERSALAADRKAHPERTRVWVWAPGFVSPEGCDVRHVEEVTGFQFDRRSLINVKISPSAKGLAAGFTKASWPLKDDMVVDPVLIVRTNATDEVWATFPDGSPAVVVRRYAEGGSDVFVSPIRLQGPEMVGALARLAGVQIYAPPGRAAVWAAENFVMVQASEAGDIPLDFGRETTVVDAISGKRYGFGPKVKVNFEKGDVKIFRLDPPPTDAERMNATQMNRMAKAAIERRVDGGAFRVLIYGNSVLKHRPAPSIGWTNDWGMAASSREKDFAHLLIKDLERSRGARADYVMRGLYWFEKDHRNFDVERELAEDIAFKPDYVVIAIGENVGRLDDKASQDIYRDKLVELAQAFKKDGRRPIILFRAPFWKNPLKAAITLDAATRTGSRYVDASVLDAPENKALGLFAHSGVAGHPGDLGMRRIADLIFKGLTSRYIRPETPVIQEAAMPRKGRLHLYLLMGQSNMAGRGALKPSNILASTPRLLMFDEKGQWRMAAEPLHADKSVAGAGLGMSFGRTMVDSGPIHSVGLVPCAVGGTPLSQWMPGAPLYVKAVERAKEAMKSGRLTGILWHQGETDANSAEAAATYGERFRQMITRLREDLGQGDVRVIVGGLGQFLDRRVAAGKGGAHWREVDAQLRASAKELPNCFYVPADGLEDGGDMLHFSTPALREFGERYARQMRGGIDATVTHVIAPFKAYVGGREVKVHAARVSAFPLNQEWPGYQRPLDQTKIDYFVSFDTPGPCEIAFDLPGGVPKGLRIRPLGIARAVRTEGGRLVVPVRGPEQFVVELGADGPVVSVFANPPFVYRHVPGEIYFGPGEHDVGVIAPTNGQTVCIDEGAIVYGTIYAYKAKDVRVTGRGIIDVSKLHRGDRESAPQRYVESLGLNADFQARANCCLTVNACTNVTVEGLVFRDSSRWSTVVRGNSRGITLDNVKVIGQWRYTTDGLDICSSQDVAVRNSFFRSFDDCIVARGTMGSAEIGPVRGIRVENCVLWCDWGKNLEIIADGRPCTIEDVEFRDIACIAVDNVACNIVACGRRGITFRDIRYRNIEVDFPSPRWRGRLQRIPGEKFVFEPKPSGVVAYISGTSSPVPIPQEAMCRIENVSFDGVRVYGDETNTVISVVEPVANNVFKDIVFNNVPPTVKIRRVQR
ncbi:MAG: hypothetical protein IKO72_13280 [Kiritimatiellae bacterium]|nr:hypothetical protein [Kiritimatiellia bacterium]